MTETDFYLNAALYAMQGMQESGGKLSDVAELFPKMVAKHAFDFADAMLEEAKNRGMFAPIDDNVINESDGGLACADDDILPRPTYLCIKTKI